MKRIYIAVAILALAITVSVYSHAVFERKLSVLTDGLYGLLDLSQTADLSVIKSETDKFCLLWEESSNALHILTIHSEMDGAEMSILALRDLLDNGEIDEFRLSCITALSTLENLRDSEKLTPGNILSVRPPNLQFVHNTEKYKEMY